MQKGNMFTKIAHIGEGYFYPNLAKVGKDTVEWDGW